MGEVQRHQGVMGWMKQSTGQDMIRTGLLLSPAVLSMTQGHPHVRRPPRIKERGGSNLGYRMEGVGTVCMTLSVLRQLTLSSTL